MRYGSAPNFAPPEEEGAVFTFEDENGEKIDLEFLGLILMNEARYAFFFPISEDAPALSSGEVVLLEVTAMDEDGQPVDFELVTDEETGNAAWEAFREASKGLYDFE
ncbi:DUF1292 domain-containing protein [Curtanaerobium respiraculi]|uniref:DUF1292 domain-containing protein n=1 Tax=Curtanaerobium respiraculi TaxID=2949669 RepID=UPI0024B31F8B|nr:DUF1292 domain-containing protein [Curtanaerobium respiraculi]